MFTLGSLRIPDAPVNVGLHVTSRCNLNCVYCYSESGETPAGDELSDSEWLNIADQLVANRVFQVRILGGEPLLCKSLFDIIQRLRENHIKVQLSTNGTLFTREIAQRFSELDVSVYFSLDGGSEEMNQLTRGRGVFAKVVKAIEWMSETTTPAVISMSLTRKNIGGVHDSVKTFRKLGIKKVCFNSIYVSKKVRNDWELLCPLPSENDILSKEIQLVRVDFPEMQFGGGFLAWVDLFNSSGKGENTETIDAYWDCGAGTIGCDIKPDGEIIPCTAMWDYKCGNVRNSTVIDIWRNSEVLLQFRRAAAIEYFKTGVCNGCKYQRICKGGCHARALTSTGTHLARDLICWKENGVVRNDDEVTKAFLMGKDIPVYEYGAILKGDNTCGLLN